MNISSNLDLLPRLKLCNLPTPVTRLHRLEQELGSCPEIYMKRDDLIDVGLGGTKGRKLEFLLAEAKEQGADTVVGTGDVHSNCCRQAALAASSLGFDVHLFFRGDRPEKLTGNLLLSHLCDAEFHFMGTEDSDEIDSQINAFITKARQSGKKPYLIPRGGSNPVGALGYVAGTKEILKQEEELGFSFDRIFFATGSGSNQAGLTLGRRIFNMKTCLVPICVRVHPDKQARKEMIAEIATGTARLLKIDEKIGPEDIDLIYDYVGEDYGIPSEQSEYALHTLARLEGIVLDHTYTGKAMYGLMDYIKRGLITPEERILFIHTGGSIGLFK